MKTHVSILGAGSWGRALALLISDNGHRVRLWSRTPPRHPLPVTVCPTIPDAVHGADMVVGVVPSHAMREVMGEVAPFLSPHTIVLSCAKGIEVASGRLMSEVLGELLPQHPASHHCFLSGPSFAEEIVERQPTAVVVAGTDAAVTARVQRLLRNDYFLPYSHDDVPGVEVGGAVKNVLAIASGMVDGLGFGTNTRAALITRGLYEMIKIGQAYRARPLTFSGLAGIGDLILTCTGTLSRNRQVGLQLAKGKKLPEILSEMHMVAEGVKTAEALQRVIRHHTIRAPICTEVYHILYDDKSPRQALSDIMAMAVGEEQGALR